MDRKTFQAVPARQVTLVKKIAAAMAKATLDYQRARKLIKPDATTYSPTQPKPSYEVLAQATLDTIADNPIDKL